jgi:Phage protein Gp19/Gp15/Gp42
MAAFATVPDYETRLKMDITETADIAQMEALLGDVSLLIRKRRPLIDAWIAAGKLDADWVRAVTVQVVARLINSIEHGAGIESETYPEWSYRLSKAAAAGLSLTDSELADLTPETEGYGRAFSIHPG